MKMKNNILKNILKEFKFNYILFFIIITSLVFIYSTYAWFSSTLNVEISDFNVIANTDTGLNISLDGINWGESIVVSKKSIISDLKNTYRNNTNQWSDGITTVSSIGLLNNTDNKFTIFKNNKNKINRIHYDNTDKVNLVKVDETKQNENASIIAFDIFFRNNSGSPKNDNLYLSDETQIYSNGENLALNSIRLGMVFMGITNKDAKPETIQSLSCTSYCSSFIYEPNHNKHNKISINNLRRHGLYINDNTYYSTYASIKDGNDILIWSGVENSNIPFNSSLFKLQETIKDLKEPIYSIPNGITKARLYIWIESQDIDAIEEVSDGYDLRIKLNFEKDLAGYN